MFGGRGYAYTPFETPRRLIAMDKQGGWTPAEIAAKFDAAVGEHLQPIGSRCRNRGVGGVVVRGRSARQEV